MPVTSGKYWGVVDWFPEENRVRHRHKPDPKVAQHKSYDSWNAYVDMTDYFESNYVITAYTTHRTKATVESVLKYPELYKVTNNYWLSAGYNKIRDAHNLRLGRRPKNSPPLNFNKDMGAQTIFESVPFEVLQRYWKKSIPLDDKVRYKTPKGKYRNRKWLTTINTPFNVGKEADERIGIVVNFNATSTYIREKAGNSFEIDGYSATEIREWLMRIAPDITLFTDEPTVFHRSAQEVCFMADFLG